MPSGKRNIAAEKVMMAYPFYGSVTAEFHVSCMQLVHYDVQTSQRLAGVHSWHCAVGSTNIADGRNKAVRAFLDDPARPDWLWFVDTDQQFAPNILDSMVESADPVERPILSALVMAKRPERARPIAPACVIFNEDGLPVQPPTIPAERWWQVAAIGTGCCLIHRSVLEKVGAEFDGKTPFPWFEFSPWKREENGKPIMDMLGEDYTFCLRAARFADAPCTVDTTIEAGHVKTHVLSSADFWAQFPREALEDRTFVIIPTKNNLKDLKALVRDLHDQGDAYEIVIMDNGAPKHVKDWLGRQTFARVLSADGMGIHQMWNAGAVLATRSFPKVNIAFLNDDLRIGPGFLKGLRDALRESDLAAVGPNYDGREGSGLQQVHGICANRYDGTGGLPGFAFMTRGELFQQGYRFPDVCKWWFGDNDLTTMLDMSGLPYGLNLDVTVEHLDGGGKTGAWDDPEMQAQLLADQTAWFEHLRKLGIQVEARSAA